MSNYTATVVEINNIRPHENADKLVCTNIFGNNVIVGLDTKIGDTGLFFPLESQIGLEFAQANDLIRRKDENGKSAGGMFDQNRRVRAQTFRGEKSMGFFIPIEALSKLENVLDMDIASIKVGDEFEMFCGYEISKKYVVPTKQVQQSGKQGSKAKKQAERSKIVDGQWKFHFDTAQLGRNLHKIHPDDLISITWKLHGCFPAHQKVLMWDGSKKNINKVIQGDIVVGFKNGNIVPSVVKNVFNNGSNSEWVVVKHTSGDRVLGSNIRSVTCTKNHRFLTQRGYVEAKDLSQQDQLIFISKHEEASDFQKSILMGLYLGDGSVSRHAGLITFSHKVDHEDYLDYLIEILGDMSTGTKEYKRSGYGVYMVRSTTKVSPFVKYFLNNYQKDGGKTLTKDMVKFVTPLSLAIWYMDDGSLNKANPTLRADFAICRYKNEDLNVIKDIFTKFDIKVYIREHNGYSRLTVAAEDSDKFFNIVSMYIPESMNYKLPDEYKYKFKKPVCTNSVKLFKDELVNVISVSNSYLNHGNKYDLETETNNYVAGNSVVHNSSGITSHILTTKKLRWYEKLAKKLGLNIVDTHYDYAYASRKVIKGVEGNIEEKKEQNHFYGLDLWGEVGKELFFNKLHSGETCYYEIVGYLPNGKFIQNQHDYGCEVGKYKVYVYRITQTNVDGVVTELPWHQVKHRAIEIGVETVPEIYYGKPDNWLAEQYMGYELGYDFKSDDFLTKLQENYVYDQDSQFCKNKVPEEGIVVRVERGDGIENFKLKSAAHYMMETKELDSGEANIEDSQEEE